jgi:hypothetical protein
MTKPQDEIESVDKITIVEALNDPFMLVAIHKDDAIRILEHPDNLKNTTTQILHIVTYKEKPTQLDGEALYNELKNDPTFGLTDVDICVWSPGPEMEKEIREKLTQ